MDLEKNSKLPLYVQVMKDIKNQIHSGKFKEGDQIPTEGELSKIYGVSRITVRRTIEELCKQGYLIKMQGKGTFVETPKIYRKLEQNNTMSFTEACHVNGRKPSSHVISAEMVPAKKKTADFLGMEENAPILQIQRVLSADDLPVIFETIYLPGVEFAHFPIYKLENGSLTQLLHEEYKVEKAVKGRSIIEVGTVMQDVADYLHIAAGEPVMLMKNYLYDENDAPLYVSYEVIVGTRYQISV